MNSHLLNLSAKPAKSSESNWAFYYSVNAQSLLMFLVSVYLVLLSPFSTESENEHVNFIYDFVFGRLDSIQLSAGKFSSLLFLGFVYGPMKFIKEFLPTIPNINILLLTRLILASLSILSWRFAQKEISKSFGSRVAVYHFIIEMFQIYQSDLSSRFLDVNLIKMTLLVSVGFWLRRRFSISLLFACFSLPILKENSFKFLLSLFPLFLNFSIFDFEPFSMFSYLSILSVLICLGRGGVQSQNIIKNVLNSVAVSSWWINPLNLLIVPSAISGIFLKNHFSLKFVSIYLFGNVIGEYHQNQNTSSSFFTFLSLAGSIGFAQISKHFQIKKSYESVLIKAFLLLLSVKFGLDLSKSNPSSPIHSSSLSGAFRLNDLLIKESSVCPNELIKTHVSKTVQAMGFSKFLTVNNPEIFYEFGTSYDQKEMLQKFKFRIADINEHVDPAYWKTHSVHKGETKILVRIQSD